MPYKNNSRLTILGININETSEQDVISRSISAINGHDEQIHITCANPHSLVTARNDSKFTNALNDSEIVVADGSGLILLTKLLGPRVPPRITGHDCFTGILEKLNHNGSGKVFFFGSSKQVLSLIESRFKTHYPSLDIVGVYSPPFGDWDKSKNDEMIKIINSTSPDILWVGMTAPKQEKWVYQNRNQLNAKVIGSIGAVFDFYAGTFPRAPQLLTKLGLEWLYRLYSEPRRMWRRNFISSPLFLYYAIVERLFK